MIRNTGAPRGYLSATIDTTDSGTHIHQTRLFEDNIALLLQQKEQILMTPEYFLSPLSFCYASVGVSGFGSISAALRLGHLLFGWEQGILINQCNHCQGQAYIVAFGGNLKSSSCWYRMWCQNCRLWLHLPATKETTRKRTDSIKEVLRKSPEYFEELEQYATYGFSWSGDGLMPATKSRLTTRMLFPAVLGVYELNKIELLRDLYLWAHKRSADRYAAVRHSLGEPDPFRLKHRDALRQVIGTIVREKFDRAAAFKYLETWTAENLAEDERDEFQRVSEDEILALHEGNFARYQVRPSEFEAWRVVWDRK